MKHILLVYGQALSHGVLRDLINGDKHMHLAGEIGQASQAIAHARQQPYDMVILDVSGPDRNGLELFCDFKQALPQIPLLVINGSNLSDRTAHFIRLGCQGYLPYTATSEQVIPAIKSLAKGQPYVLTTHESIAKTNHEMRHERLTLRELQVFFKLIKGQTVNAVAEELAIAPGSVSVFRAKILKKMNVSSNAALIHYALDHHLMTRH